MKFTLLNKIRDKDLVSKSALFDRAYYLNTYPDVAQAGIDPIRHYLETGWKEGRNPSAGFNTTLYLKVNTDVEEAGLNPLVHYLRFGRQEGRRITVPELFQQYMGVQVDVQYEKNLLELFSLLENELVSPPPRSDETVDILIPDYAGLTALQALLENIARTTTGAYRLLIAHDPTRSVANEFLAVFRSRHPNNEVILVVIPRRYTIWRRIDQLARYARNHFVILAAQCILPPLWLERLVHPILAEDKVASVVPFTRSGSLSGFPDLPDLSVGTMDAYFRRVKPAHATREVPVVDGYCIAVNHAAYRHIGRFQRLIGNSHAMRGWTRRAEAAAFRHVLAANLFIDQQPGEFSSLVQSSCAAGLGARLQRQLHADFQTRVDQYIQADPLAHLRNALQMTMLAHEVQTRLVFDHGVGGGANEYTRLKLAGAGVTLIVSPDNSLHNYRVMLALKGQKTSAYRLTDLNEVTTLLEKLPCRDLVINELVSYPDLVGTLDFLLELKLARPDLHYTYITHDYYSICPSFHLLDDTGSYCGIPQDLAQCDTCLSRNPLAKDGLAAFSHKAESGRMAAWRGKFQALLEACDCIVCFSNSSRELLLKAYPALSTPIDITPHEVGWIRKVKVKKTTDRLNIAVIGYLTRIKGAAQVIALARYLQEHELNAAIHIFGPVIEPYNTEMDALANVIRHYAYSKTDLPDLMESHEIDLVFIASICPETFSYTTQEAIEMGLPVAVFDLGAPAERVRQYPAGLILAEETPEYVYNSIRVHLNMMESR